MGHVRFLIWFQHRSGSSHLVSLLNSHPEIRCQGELFGCHPVESVERHQPDSGHLVYGNRVYRRVINRFPGRIKDPTIQHTVRELDNWFSQPSVDYRSKPIRGFKFKFPSQAALFPEITEFLAARSQYLRVIVLSRKNYLRRAISVLNLNRVRTQTQQANVRQPLELEPVELDVAEVVRLVEYYQSIEHDFQNWARQFCFVFHLDYDQLLSQLDPVAEGLQNFLQVKQIALLKSTTHRIGKDKLEDSVLNAEDIRRAVSDLGLLFE